MLTGLKQIKIYFPINMSEQWMGGVNYYKNLFQAISMVEQSDVEIYIPDKNPEILYKYANKFKNEKDWKYQLSKFYKIITFKKFDRKLYFSKRFKDIDVISHIEPLNYGGNVIYWIPDFQHIHLKELFSQEELLVRNTVFKKSVEESSIVILSSKDAQNDFINLYPDYVEKSRVLNFVSYIDPSIYDISQEYKNKIKQKYNLPDKYFYLPNQFWEHKNHITVFKAINHLKTQGINIQLVCSGFMQDYRNKNYLENVLYKYIKDNHIEDNIHFLGVISLDEVYYLMRNCISIINPSLFEGWSSTVEEAKSIGKNIILSDLNVHKEQNPPEGTYFSRENFVELAGILKDNWLNNESAPNYKLEEMARNNMDKRMVEFGKKYINIASELIKKV